MVPPICTRLVFIVKQSILTDVWAPILASTIEVEAATQLFIEVQIACVNYRISKELQDNTSEKADKGFEENTDSGEYW